MFNKLSKLIKIYPSLYTYTSVINLTLFLFLSLLCLSSDTLSSRMNMIDSSIISAAVWLTAPSGIMLLATVNQGGAEFPHERGDVQNFTLCLSDISGQ